MMGMFSFFVDQKRHEEVISQARRANKIAEDNNKIAEDHVKLTRIGLYIAIATSVISVVFSVFDLRMPFSSSGERYSFIHNDSRTGKPLIKGESGNNANRDGRWLIYYSPRLGSGINIDANYENNILNGLYTEYYKNGNKKIEGEYNNGSPDGVWYEYSIDDPEPIKIIDHTKPFFLVKVWNDFVDDSSSEDENEGLISSIFMSEDENDDSSEPFFLVKVWDNLFDDSSSEDDSR